MPAWQIALIVIGVLLAAVIAWVIVTYNTFVRMRNRIEEAWRQVDVELHRRAELIPNLVETVQGYAAHERSTLDSLVNARAAAAGAGNRDERLASENKITQAISKLFAVAEAYPDLKANQNFQQLQAQLAETEDRIANGRRYYNATVREFNTKLETFPSSVIGRSFNFQRATYFEAEESARVAPQVSFPRPDQG